MSAVGQFVTSSAAEKIGGGIAWAGFWIGAGIAVGCAKLAEALS
jgi:hypothetical protein